MGITPIGTGCSRSVMSTKPTCSCAGSEYASIMPSAEAETISATVWVSVLHVGSICLQTAKVVRRVKNSSVGAVEKPAAVATRAREQAPRSILAWGGSASEGHATRIFGRRRRWLFPNTAGTGLLSGMG
jgi:hypothetical protein